MNEHFLKTKKIQENSFFMQVQFNALEKINLFLFLFCIKIDPHFIIKVEY